MLPARGAGTAARALAEAGIEIPATFDLKGIVGLILSLLGLTWASIRARLAKVLPDLLRDGDLLLLDMQVARGSVDDPAEIKKRDRTWSSGVSPAHAAWLSGPIWRHCKDVLSVEFHWNLDTQCPVPGSYALDAVATVQSRGRADRHQHVGAQAGGALPVLALRADQGAEHEGRQQADHGVGEGTGLEGFDEAHARSLAAPRDRKGRHQSASSTRSPISSRWRLSSSSA